MNPDLRKKLRVDRVRKMTMGNSAALASLDVGFNKIYDIDAAYLKTSFDIQSGSDPDKKVPPPTLPKPKPDEDCVVQRSRKKRLRYATQSKQSKQSTQYMLKIFFEKIQNQRLRIA